MSNFDAARKLGANGFYLYAYLVHVLAPSGEGRISYAQMRQDTGLHLNTISKHLHELIRIGAVLRQKMFSATSIITINRNYVDYYYLINLINLSSSNSTVFTLLEGMDESQEKENGIDHDPATPFNQLSDAFTQSAFIMPYNWPKWTEAVNYMVLQSVTPVDVTQAVSDLTGKNYKITGPWSVQNAAVTAKSQRMRKNGNGHKKDNIIDL